MNLLLKSSIVNLQSAISITGSKSETNRLLLLQALYSNLILENSSNSDDSEVMAKALSTDYQTGLVEVHHAGTTMRFLTAFFAIQENRDVVLTGSSRMQERPIKILVDALRLLGAEISYEANEGFPPIRIKGKKLIQNKVSLPANVSSQYISALLLIAPKLKNGLELTLKGEITSVPYIKMTLSLLNEIDVKTSFVGNKITVKSLSHIPNPLSLIVESDWSSASYFYSIIALSEIGTEITLSSYKKNSLQGDSVLAEIYKDFGVETVFDNNKIHLKKFQISIPKSLILNLNNSPDIAQTIAVTCFGLGIGCHLTGLHTLKIKETDRLEALKTELSKLGASVSVTNSSLTLQSYSPPLVGCPKGGVAIKTYQDHRMAMAFAPLALKTDLIIDEPEVVSKSYPTFWNDLKKIGFVMDEL
jgi:3-phosphoshikimate 1-carboxyvinyltransferase